MTVTRKWSLLTGVLIVAILAASWFLLIAPKHSKAAAIKTQTAAQEDANTRLKDKISQLMAQQQDLPRQIARLAQIRGQIPDNPALPTLIRDLSTAAKKSGLSLDSLAPSEPSAITDVVVPVAVAPTAAAASSTTDSAAPTVAAPAAPAPSLFAVPLQLNAAGSYFEVEQFLNKLEGMKRSFLVTGFSLKANPTAGAPNQLAITITARVFLSPAQAAAAVNPAAVSPTVPAAK
jgi:type IV pilus assembly protein PilO